MFVPSVFALIYLVLAVHLTADLSLEIGERRKGMRVTLRAWGMSLTLDRPITLPRQGLPSREKADRLRAVWPMLKAGLRAVRWGHADARMRIGLHEASLTAVVSGALLSGASALRMAAGDRFPCSVWVEPDFQSPVFHLQARCIFSAVPGDIILAAAKAAVKKTQREGFKWLSIPLKA